MEPRNDGFEMGRRLGTEELNDTAIRQLLGRIPLPGPAAVAEAQLSAIAAEADRIVNIEEIAERVRRAFEEATRFQSPGGRR